MASPLELLKSLSEHGVEFVLVGGMAGIVHGSSVVTEDLDLAISFDVNTMEKVLAALDAFSPRLNAPGRPELPSPDARHYVGWRNLYLVTSAGPLALLGEITGVGRFEEVKRVSERIALAGVTVSVLSIEALIRAKRAVGRPKDLRTASELEHVLAAKKRP